jgi:hypothetical protein
MATPKKTYKKISQLNSIQKSHLAWRIDNKTGVGMLTAAKIARGDQGDKNLDQIFIECGCTERSAKIYARKVQNFKL